MLEGANVSFHMAQNTLPSRVNELMRLAESVARGLEMHGPWLGMTPAADFRTLLAELRKTQATLESARAAKTLAALRMIADDEALRAWLAKARLAVMLARGAQWSEGWLDTGFTYRRTDVPKTVQGRIALAAAVVDFFARNPEFGIAHADVTATCGRKRHSDVIRGRQILRQLAKECARARRAHDVAERLLRRQMRAVVIRLGMTIDGNDTRWTEFGFKQRDSCRDQRSVSRKGARAITSLPSAREQRGTKRAAVAA